jgi:hypothetical protein
MKTTRKTIKRKTQTAANNAMAKHIEKMLAKGWSLGDMFAGNAFLKYEVIVYFNK